MEQDEFRFVFVGNNVAVDFINTEIVSRGEQIDLLSDGAALIKWAHDAGFKVKSRLSTTDLSSALALRQALRDIYLARIDKLPAPRKALSQLNQHLANHSEHQVLQYNMDGNEYKLTPAHDAITMPELLGILAYEGAKLLASTQAKRLKRCCNTDCILIFMDSSRGQKRRWCSMEVCGNRAKVATHYRNSLPL